ncbi:uncharacterized protein FFMR_08024 [Fusarium fujikuroi]|nr:uncharacterized protein FFM5_05150 [Fusarium fujikuroi]SCO45419.1 uncharacterized protein FFMR_08024 [Fusarium fujikuroi]
MENSLSAQSSEVAVLDEAKEYGGTEVYKR